MFDWKNFIWGSVDYRMTALEVELNHTLRKSKRLTRMYGNIYPVALDCRRFRNEPTITDSMVVDFTKNINMVYSINSLARLLSYDENYVFHDTQHIEDTITHYESLLRDLIYIHRSVILFYNTNGLDYVPPKIEEYGEFLTSIVETIFYVDDVLDKLNVYILTDVDNSLIADIVSQYI